MRRLVASRHAATRRTAWLAGFVSGLMSIAGPPAAVADEHQAASARSGQQVLIREHAGWDRDCDAIAHPALLLEEPPRHGSVCARIEDVEIRYMYVGTAPHCIGRVVRGIRLFYRADGGYAGPDRWRYAAQYPAARRSVAVTVAVEPDAAAARGATAAGAAGRFAVPPQSAGPVPECGDRLS